MTGIILRYGVTMDKFRGAQGVFGYPKSGFQFSLAKIQPPSYPMVPNYYNWGIFILQNNFFMHFWDLIL